MLPDEISAFRFTVWSQVDTTLCQQQCVVTHSVFTRMQGENQQLCLGDGCAVCFFSQLFTTQHHEKCQEWPNKHKLVKSTLHLALVWERDGVKSHTEDTQKSHWKCSRSSTNLAASRATRLKIYLLWVLQLDDNVIVNPWSTPLRYFWALRTAHI